MYETLIHRSNGFKNSKQICDTILTLPMNPYLRDEEIEEVINIILMSV
jgi:dTDP-4-amino-4,6-dideoxygalactose transaminase